MRSSLPKSPPRNYPFYQISCKCTQKEMFLTFLSRDGDFNIAADAKINRIISLVFDPDDSDSTTSGVLQEYFLRNADEADHQAVRMLVNRGFYHAAFKMIVMTADARNFDDDYESDSEEELLGDAVQRATEGNNARRRSNGSPRSQGGRNLGGRSSRSDDRSNDRYDPSSSRDHRRHGGGHRAQ